MQTPRIIQITGATNCGKSTLLRELIAPITRCIIIAPYGKNYDDTLAFQNLPQLTAALKEKRPRTFRVVLTVQKHELAELCRLAWVVAPVTLVFDETFNVFTKGEEPPREFIAVCQGGRHAGYDEQRWVSVIAIGQRPVNLPTVFRSEVEDWFLFQLRSRKDRKLLEDDFGLPKEIAEHARTLPDYHYMKVDKRGTVTYGQTTL